MKKYLIADSGGTSTDWCFVDEAGERNYFSTESYHPIRWNAHFEKAIQNFWKQHPEMLDAEVHFFGAGCFNAANAERMKSILEGIGFKNTHVRSDLHGAALAVLGVNNGWGAILGTGSVMFEWKGREITQLIGGKGHDTGDEGSGFYFGKLVYQAFLDNRLTDEQCALFEDRVDEMGLVADDASPSIKYAFAHISKDLGDEPCFADFHRINLRMFCSSHMSEVKVRELSFVGSYAYHQREELQQTLAEFNVRLKVVVKKPIAQIVEQIVVSVD